MCVYVCNAHQGIQVSKNNYEHIISTYMFGKKVRENKWFLSRSFLCGFTPKSNHVLSEILYCPALLNGYGNEVENEVKYAFIIV